MSKDVVRSVLCLLPENEIHGLEEFRQKYIINLGRLLLDAIIVRR